MDPMLIAEHELGARIVQYDEEKYRLETDESLCRLRETDPENEDRGRDIVGNLAAHLFQEIMKIERIGVLCKGFLEEEEEEGDFLDYNLGTLLRELVENAWYHGNKRDPEKVVDIAYGFEEVPDDGYAVLTLVVRDQGSGFDCKALERAEQETRGRDLTYKDVRTDDSPPGSIGCGLFDTIRYCDSVTWNEPGNEITVVKHLPLDARPE